MSTASAVNAISTQISRYTPFPILALGLFGNIVNMLIFIRPRLLGNPCSTYFFWASITNLNVLFFGLVTRVLSEGFGIDPVSNNLGFCRFRYFILHSSMVLSSWFTILAGVDRYCISSRSITCRQHSNLRSSRLLVALTTLVCFALYSHVFALFTIEQLQSGPSCYAQAGAYRIFYDFFYFATYSFTPPLVMVAVGLATFYNVHHVHRAIQPADQLARNARSLKRRDRQLIKMTLVQVLCAILLTLPIAVQKLYVTFTQGTTKSAYQVAIEGLVAQLLRFFVFINCSTSFYL